MDSSVSQSVSPSIEHNSSYKSSSHNKSQNQNIILQTHSSSTTQARSLSLARTVADRRRWKIMEPSPKMAPRCCDYANLNESTHPVYSQR